MADASVLTRPDWVARQRTTLAYLAGLLHVMPPDADGLRLLARLFDAIPGDEPVEPEAFYGQLTRAVAELVGARRVAFLVRTNGTLRWQPQSYGFPGQLISQAQLPCRSDGSAPLDLVVFKDFTLAGPLSNEASAPHADVLRSLDTMGALAVPWRAGDERLGTLIAFDPPQVESTRARNTWVLRVAAGLAAMVWQRARERMTEREQQEARQLRASIGRLASLEKAKSDFLSLASHELRVPLTVLAGNLSLLADGSLGPMTPQQQHAAPIMQAKVHQMTALINRMLEVSRLEDSRVELQLELVDVLEVIHGAVRTIQPMTQPGQRIVLDAPATPMYVLLDRFRAETIVFNLLDNAVKYSPQGTDVGISVVGRDGTARIAVRDRGIGIDPADMPRLFTRFGRMVRDDYRHIAGMGLGLYLARELAGMHGGDITVTSAPGEGSEFLLTLPLASRGIPEP